MRRFLTMVLTILLLLQSVVPSFAVEADLTQQPDLAAAAMETEPEQQVHEAATEAQPEQQVDEAATEAEPEQQVDEAATEAEPERQADEAATEAEPEQQVDEAATEAQPEQQVDEAATEARPEQQTNETAAQAEQENLQPEPTEVPDDESVEAPDAELEQTTDAELTEPVEVSEAEEPVLYNGLEADYDDPQFLKLLEEGFFQDENTPVRALAGSIRHDSRFKGYEITKGVDVSKWNGTIDWERAKRDGIDFAIIRCGNRRTKDGSLDFDPDFDRNMRGAMNAGMEVGVYIFSQAITESEAVEEANFALKMCRGYDFTLPIVFDYEYYPNGRLERHHLSDAKHTSICKAFCKKIKDAGYPAMVYANKSMLEDDMYAQQLTDAGYEVWLAYWTGDPSGYRGTYTYWQYSDAGMVNGFPHKCDVNYRYHLPSAKIRQVTNLSSGIRLVWNEVQAAEGYRILRKNPGARKWTELATVKDSDVVSYIDQSVSQGKEYVYTVQAFDGLIQGDYDEAGVEIQYEKTLTLDKAELTSQGVKLSWSKDSKYESYRILRKAGNGWKQLAELGPDQTHYVDQGSFKSGTVYTYTIAGMTQGTQVIHDEAGFGVTWMDTPKLLKTIRQYDGIQVRWKAVSGAKKYLVFRRKPGEKWALIKTVKTLTYTDTSAKSGINYEYTVRGANAEQLSGYNTDGVTGYYLGTPKMKDALGQKNGKSVLVTWGAVKGAVKYRVFRKESAKAGWKTIGWTNKPSYTDNKVKKGKTYYYTVRAAGTEKKATIYSGYEKGVQVSWVATPKLKKAQLKNNGIVVQWGKVPGATGYAVYRKTEKTKWKKIATVKNMATYTDLKPVKGTENFYTVRATNGKEFSGYDNTGVSALYLQAPGITKAAQVADGVKIVWKEVAGAEKYRVYRSNNKKGGWTAIGWTTEGSFVDTEVEHNKTYFYTLRAAAKKDGKNVYSGYLPGTEIHCLDKPVLKKAVQNEKGVTVSWKRVSGASAYVIFRREAGGKWTKLAQVSNSLSYLDQKARADRQYEYTVRARDGSFYSWYDTDGIAPNA